MTPTLCSTVTQLDGETFNYGSQQDAVFRAIADDFFTQPDRQVPGLFRSGASTAIMNAGHLFDTNPMKRRSLSDAMVKGRAFARDTPPFSRST
jgi:hypothetical protein